MRLIGDISLKEFLDTILVSGYRVGYVFGSPLIDTDNGDRVLRLVHSNLLNCIHLVSMSSSKTSASYHTEICTISKSSILKLHLLNSNYKIFKELVGRAGNSLDEYHVQKIYGIIGEP